MPGVLGGELLPPQSYRAPVGQGHDIHAIWEDAKALGSLGGAGRALAVCGCFMIPTSAWWSSVWWFSLVRVGRKVEAYLPYVPPPQTVDVPAHEARCRPRTSGAEEPQFLLLDPGPWGALPLVARVPSREYLRGPEALRRRKELGQDKLARERLLSAEGVWEGNSPTGDQV